MFCPESGMHFCFQEKVWISLGTVQDTVMETKRIALFEEVFLLYTKLNE